MPANDAVHSPHSYRDIAGMARSQSPTRPPTVIRSCFDRSTRACRLLTGRYNACAESRFISREINFLERPEYAKIARMIEWALNRAGDDGP